MAGGLSEIGSWVNLVSRRGHDNRGVWRVDAEYFLNDANVLRFGIDQEDNFTNDVYGYSGPNFDYFRYYDVDSRYTRYVLRNAGEVPAGVSELVRHRVYKGGGKFGGTNASLYFEDEWLINESLNVRLGLRHERFEIENSDGGTVVRFKDQWAPRLGIAWSLDRDNNDWGTITASYSRYHLSLPSSVSRRLAFGYEYTEDGHVLGGEIQDDSSVELGEQIGSTIVYSDGSLPKTDEVVDTTLKPMYQDEITLGYSREFPNEIHGGVDYTFRRLGVCRTDTYQSRLECFRVSHSLIQNGNE